MRGYIEKGVAEGAKLVTGGAEAPEGLDRGYFVRPTVFSEVTPEMTIAQEEIFGPVLAIQPYDDEDDAVRIANDTDYGLAGGVWSADQERAIAVARRIRTGQIEINGGAFNPLAPFGGYKQSRPRPRERPLRHRGVAAGQVAAALGRIGSPAVNFDLTDEQRLLRDTVRDFARQEVAPVAEELDRTKSLPLRDRREAGRARADGDPVPAGVRGRRRRHALLRAGGRRAGADRLLGLHHDGRPHLAGDDADPPLGQRRAEGGVAAASSAAASGSPPSA